MLRQHESFAGYVIEGVLGHGGMGTVYLARHPRLPRLVALKLLNRAVSEDEELRRRFEQEANVVARLEHPGIVGVYDRGTQDGHLWISMQYIRGTDASRLDPHTTRPESVLRIVTDTAHALDYAHSKGVLHRDIKPANILIAEPEAGRETRAVLTDFGIARLLDADTKLTATGTFTATLAYASPEQLSGEPVDHRADQYSLGCTLFTLLAGQPPFPSTNPGQIVAGHLAKPVPRLSGTRPELPPPLDAVIARAMAKHRDERFASCGDFAAAAAAALRGDAPFARSVPARTVVNQHPAYPVTAVDPWPRPAPTLLNQPPDPARRALSGTDLAAFSSSGRFAPAVRRPRQNGRRRLVRFRPAVGRDRRPGCHRAGRAAQYRPRPDDTRSPARTSRPDVAQFRDVAAADRRLRRALRAQARRSRGGGPRHRGHHAARFDRHRSKPGRKPPRRHGVLRHDTDFRLHGIVVRSVPFDRPLARLPTFQDPEMSPRRG
ncbi:MULTISPECIES: serine/threonine-protein kinase [Nocardia]|uniref:serine/threonine-protein kinase n=1 Tax=Nocardia TaxID=1817 RepID=UPI002454C2AD|nr:MULTISPECIES: serine/threonine-protein kinase [Nocardia]